MNHLPIENVYRNDDEHRARVAKLKAERDMNADEIRAKLTTLLENAGFLTRQERTSGSYGRYSEHPFDLVAGQEKDLKLIGFEIKADKDSFDRLKRQMLAYLHVCDAVYVVLHKKMEPEWLPEGVGVIRAFDDGTFLIEQESYLTDPLAIGAEYLWDNLWAENGLSSQSKRTRSTMELISGVRRNVLFNRYFATESFKNGKATFSKYWPLSPEQKELIIGFDLPTQYRRFEKDMKELEERLAVMKRVAGLK